MIYYISKLSLQVAILNERPYGQAVKTTPSHGVNSGSSPDKVTNEATLYGWRFSLEILSGMVKKPIFGFGKMQASIRERFSLSEAKAPVLITNEATLYWI